MTRSSSYVFNRIVFNETRERTCPETLVFVDIMRRTWVQKVSEVLVDYESASLLFRELRRPHVASRQRKRAAMTKEKGKHKISKWKHIANKFYSIFFVVRVNLLKQPVM